MANTKPMAAVTVITVETEHETFVVLGVEDPRWHLKSDGTYEGVKAIEHGAAKPLPLRPGFIGGGINARETAKEAALREIKEEGGHGLFEQASKVELQPIFTSLRKDDDAPPTTYYFHAHLKMKHEQLTQCLKQGKEGTARNIDDSVALMLVKPEQILRSEQGYVLKGPPAETPSWRGFTPVPLKAGASSAQQQAIALYNARGAQEPLIGIDQACLNGEIPLYTPPGGDAKAALSDKEIAAKSSFSHVSNGALFEIVKQQLQEKPAPARVGAARG